MPLMRIKYRILLRFLGGMGFCPSDGGLFSSHSEIILDPVKPFAEQEQLSLNRFSKEPLCLLGMEIFSYKCLFIESDTAGFLKMVKRPLNSILRSKIPNFISEYKKVCLKR